MRIRNKTIPIVFLAILLGVFALAFMTNNERYIAVPGFACVVMVLWLWMRLWDRDRQIPFFDVGIFCALSTLVYTIYPLVNYWLNGFQFGILSDSRLYRFRISPEELGFFHLRHTLYLFAFVVTYALFRARGTIEVGNVSPPSRSSRQIIVLFFLVLTGYSVLLGILTGANYSSEPYGERIASEIAIQSSMPLPLLQISNKLVGIRFVFKLAFLFIVVSRCRQKKWLIILLLWVTAEISQAFILKGSRTGLVLFLMATALLYHRMIKPLSMKFLITLGTLLFVFFNFLGLYRAYIDFASLQSVLSHTGGNIFSGNNEFQALLGTSYDVLQMRKGGVDFPWYLYINDFISILPPQQIMPFEKIKASEWYLQQIGLSGTGVGFMWGVITQSIVGFDWVELALRGAILGYLLARFHRWYLKHQSKFLATILYVFICLKVYYTFRDTTFSLLTNLVWEIFPSYILLRLGVALVHKVTYVRHLRKTDI